MEIRTLHFTLLAKLGKSMVHAPSGLAIKSNKIQINVKTWMNEPWKHDK